jgi:hypothetical protein
MNAGGSLELSDLVEDFRTSLVRVDSTRPVWRSTTTGTAYQAGIGPHPETETVRLISEDLRASRSETYGSLMLGARYPLLPRQRCDVAIGEPIQWAVEVKMLRLFGDNGKLNDNMVMHVLSPYPQQRANGCIEAGGVGVSLPSGNPHLRVRLRGLVDGPRHQRFRRPR